MVLECMLGNTLTQCGLLKDERIQKIVEALRPSNLGIACVQRSFRTNAESQRIDWVPDKSTRPDLRGFLKCYCGGSQRLNLRDIIVVALLMRPSYLNHFASIRIHDRQGIG